MDSLFWNSINTAESHVDGRDNSHACHLVWRNSKLKETVFFIYSGSLWLTACYIILQWFLLTVCKRYWPSWKMSL